MKEAILAKLMNDLGRPRRGRLSHERGSRPAPETNFTCRRCGLEVATQAYISGVQNRNHCPYCLWSRHLDWQKAGDRLSACKGLMRPVGLTLKQSGKKYAPAAGELMLVHFCEECEKISINRLAADDDVETLVAVYECACLADNSLRKHLSAQRIRLLDWNDYAIVQGQLFGKPG